MTSKAAIGANVDPVGVFRTKMMSIGQKMPGCRKRMIEYEVKLKDISPSMFGGLLTTMMRYSDSTNSTSIADTDSNHSEISLFAPMYVSVTVNAISSPHVGSSFIKVITFDPKERKSTGKYYMTKTALAYQMSTGTASRYKHTVAEECYLDGEDRLAEVNMYRFKHRWSFPLQFAGNNFRWRLDCTVVHEYTGSYSNVEEMRGVVLDILAKCETIEKQSRMSVDNQNMTALDHASQKDFGNMLGESYKFEVELELMTDPDEPGCNPIDILSTIQMSDVAYVVDKILYLMGVTQSDISKIQEELNIVQKEINPRTQPNSRVLAIRRMLPNVMAMSLTDYKTIFPPVGYYVSNKADGIRAVMSIHNGACVIISDKIHESFANIAVAMRRFIFDGEYIPAKPGGRPMFLIFDVILYDGHNISVKPFRERIEYMGKLPSIKADIQIIAKPFRKIENSSVEHMKEVFTSALHMNVKNGEKMYKSDGIIIVSPDSPYLTTDTWKWKPLDHMSIDFLARKAPAGFYDDKAIPGYTLYLLFVGISQQDYQAMRMHTCPGYDILFPSTKPYYFPIQFSPANAPKAYMYYHANTDETEIDGKIVELRCISNCSGMTEEDSDNPDDKESRKASSDVLLPENAVGWQIMGIRHDRQAELVAGDYFGNNFKLAEITWINYLAKFTEEQLWNCSTDMYFQNIKSGIYAAQTAMTNFVKGRAISTLSNDEYVVDLGAGRGSDLNRYIDAGIKNLLVVDKDRHALAELLRRRHSMYGRNTGAAKRGKDHKGKGKDSIQDTSQEISLHILAKDLSGTAENILQGIKRIGVIPEISPDSDRLPKFAADGIICNLAVHYFGDTHQSWENFAKVCGNLLRPGGKLILTLMDGGAVHNLFQDENISAGNSWDIFQGETLKYSIRRLYDDESLLAIGQYIELILPFSGGNYYKELLVNIDNLTEELELCGLVQKSRESFSEYEDEFKVNYPDKYSSLTSDDKKYLSLYSVVSYECVGK